MIEDFWIAGSPATFATAGERPWKDEIARQSRPPPGGDVVPVGLRLDFTVASLARAGHPLDVDNLGEPMFSVIVNKVGWFNARRSNIRWWRASKQRGSPTGCRIRIMDEERPALPQERLLWDAWYSGPLPRSATAPELAAWAHELRRSLGTNLVPTECILYLGFANAGINLGDISTGPVKSCIDCLYPLLGGTCGCPDDHCIQQLIVEKGVAALPDQQLRVAIWAASVMERPLPPSPAITQAVVPMQQPTPERPPNISLVRNPCRPGSRKYIVCDAAMRGLTVDETRRRLGRSPEAPAHGCTSTSPTCAMRTDWTSKSREIASFASGDCPDHEHGL